jgi:Ca2+-binding RTX toxin-like protein
VSDSYALAVPAGCERGGFYDSAVVCPQPNSIVMHLGDRNDAALDWNGPATIDGGPGDDTLFGNGGNDRLTGADGNDDLVGGAGDDVLDAGAGNDLLEFQPGGYSVMQEAGPDDTAGTDELHGGPDGDTVGYGQRTDPLTITMDGRANDGAPGENDLIGTDVEEVDGGQADDTMTGNDGSNVLVGADGNDSLRGGAGGDVLDGTMGNDTVLGESGADTVAGGHGDDLVDGGAGQDNIYGEYAIGCSTLMACIGGADEIRARDGERDLVSCGVADDHALIDRIDVIRDIPGETTCEQLDAGAPVKRADPLTAAIRSCRALLSGKVLKNCVNRAIRQAKRKCHHRKPCIKSINRKARRAMR